MRRVEVFTTKYDHVSGLTARVREGRGNFIQYGTDVVEAETTVGQFTTAIVEMDDGTVRNICVGCIQFLEEGKVETDQRTEG